MILILRCSCVRNCGTIAPLRELLVKGRIIAFENDNAKLTERTSAFSQNTMGLSRLYWDRGRPARSEREARKDFNPRLRACGALRAGRPRSQRPAIVRFRLEPLLGPFFLRSVSKLTNLLNFVAGIKVANVPFAFEQPRPQERSK